MNDKLTSYKAQREVFFYDIIETSPGQGGKHHYIVQIGNSAKICEVFSPANKELVLNALNAPQRSEAMIRELVEALEYFHKSAYPVALEIDKRGYAWSSAWLDEALPVALKAINRANQLLQGDE